MTRLQRFGGRAFFKLATRKINALSRVDIIKDNIERVSLARLH
jgi:hypothetical protein